VTLTLASMLQRVVSGVLGFRPWVISRFRHGCSCNWQSKCTYRYSVYILRCSAYFYSGKSAVHGLKTSLRREMQMPADRQRHLQNWPGWRGGHAHAHANQPPIPFHGIFKHTKPQCAAFSAWYAASIAALPPKALSLLPSTLIDALLSVSPVK
jgi:hypothetical protein